jgi:hypothetical protein
MSEKSKICITALTVLTVVVSMLAGCKSSKPDQPDGPVTTDETLRFVFLADSRGDTLPHPVNDTVLKAIIRNIDSLTLKPSFIVFGGDMSYRGYIKPNYTFDAWKALFLPLTSKGIPLYTAVGNHELYYQHSDSGFMIGNQQAFQEAFPENPSNGPAGFEHLAYSFTSQLGNSLFVVLDAYYLTHDSIPLNLGGNIDAAQMSWLRALVAKSNATHKFLFIHTPYYYVSDDPQEPSAANQTYTRLWSFLDSNKFDIYACGHSHLFSRRAIDSTLTPNPPTTPPTPKWKNNVVQLLNGTCGAGPDAGAIDPAIKAAWNVYNDHKTYYFSVIDINGNTVTVNSYKGYLGRYDVFDTFTVTK